MAISKIRKTSSWALLIVIIISVVIFALFYAGGAGEPLMKNGEALKNPKYTDLLMYWVYALFAISAISLLLFGIVKFAGKVKSDPKGSIMSIVVLVAFAALLIITYTIGSGTPIPGINADSQKYNVTSWLKITDMWLYSIYVLMALAVIAIIWGSVKKITNR